MAYYPLLIPLATLVAAVLTGLPGRVVGESKYRLGTLALAVAFVLSLLLLYQAATSGDAALQVVLTRSPLEALPTIEFRVDRLAAVMLTWVSGIGTLLYRYSQRYMQQERGRARFHTLLALAIATLQVMVVSNDLITLFIAWQLLSWLLSHLSHNFAHPPTAQSAFRTFIMLRAGDVAFLGGIILAYHLYGTVEFGPLFARAAAAPATVTLFGADHGLVLSGATAVSLLIFGGAMSKSAQFPLHLWLPDALYAPTPVCALLHAGIINAGGFLLNRLSPLYVQSPTTLHVVLAVGFITLLAGKSMMLVQNNIKKTLVYSTIGQMGYMVMECGLGAFGLAVLHLITHGLYKATLFLNCGNEIHRARQHPPTPSPPATEKTPSPARWLGGLVTSLVLPLLILVGAHDYQEIPLSTAQGPIIFLIFGWASAAQAMLTLYRLGLADSYKALGLMIVTLLIVSTGYLAVAEGFTHFLYPQPGVAAAYLQAASLPWGVFLAVMAVAVVLVFIWWLAAFAQRHSSMFMPFRVFEDLRTSLYLLVVNRFYLEALILRLGQTLRRTGRLLDRNPLVPAAVGVAALVAAWFAVTPVGAVPPGTLVQLGLAALLLPLFPAHGPYVAAVSRLPGAPGIVLSLVLPAAGTYALSAVLPGLPPALLPGIAVLALTGAVYAAVKASLQNRPSALLAYAGMAFYAVVWWHAARTGGVAPQAIVFTAAATVVTGALLLAWDRVRIRFGDLDLWQIGGLAGPMPRLGTLVALLVMVAVGLPPFGLFSGYLGMVLHPAAAASGTGMAVLLLTWFLASWYFFRFIQRLLFGPPRHDLRYDDLRPAEMAPIVVALLLLLVLGGMPQGRATDSTVTETRLVRDIAWTN